MKNFLDRVQEIRQLEQMGTAACWRTNDRWRGAAVISERRCMRCRRKLAAQNHRGICMKCRNYSRLRFCVCGQNVSDHSASGCCRECMASKSRS